MILCAGTLKADSFEVIPITFLVHLHFSNLLRGRRKKQRCCSELAVVPCPPFPVTARGTCPTGTLWQEEKGLRTEPRLSAVQKPLPSLPVPFQHSTVSWRFPCAPLSRRDPLCHTHAALPHHGAFAPALTSRSFLLSRPLRCHKYFCKTRNPSIPFFTMRTFALVAQKPSWVKTGAWTDVPAVTAAVLLL